MNKLIVLFEIDNFNNYYVNLFILIKLFYKNSKINKLLFFILNLNV